MKQEYADGIDSTQQLEIYEDIAMLILMIQENESPSKIREMRLPQNLRVALANLGMESGIQPITHDQQEWEWIKSGCPNDDDREAEHYRQLDAQDSLKDDDGCW